MFEFIVEDYCSPKFPTTLLSDWAPWINREKK